jgi:hypothetical protein
MLSKFIITCLFWSPVHGYTSLTLSSIYDADSEVGVTKQSQLDWCNAEQADWMDDDSAVDSIVDASPKVQRLVPIGATGDCFDASFSGAL